MQIDSETLADLEFFSCFGTIGQSVFQYLDYFKTDCGRDYVKGLVRNGLSPDVELADLHIITRFFYGLQGKVEFDVSTKAVKAFEEYLNSNYTGIDLTTSFNSFLHAFYYRYKYSEMFFFIRAGIKEALQLIAQVAQYIESVRRQGDMPLPVQRLFQEFSSVCAEISFDKIAEKFASPNFHGVFVADYLLRIQNGEKLRRLVAVIAKIDGHVTMAAATRKHGFVFPQIVADNVRRISVKGLYHPFLAQPVKNDFSVEKGSSMLFLTGPNMAGKTTYMKSLGIALILAHIGMGVPAASMEFSAIDQLFLQLSVHDNIRLGISSFYQEILQVKRIVELLQSGRCLMVIIDEIFKGTNVTDALDCSKTVINGFARFPEQFFLISSHLYELQQDISRNANIQFKFFDASLQNNALKFSYTLKNGVSDVRIGTRLLEEAGITGYFTAAAQETPENDFEKSNVRR